eukprot:TRINITY_DN5702_c0_g1_i4.p1 TRINITY_DN5702_c0_g1~~TRINITY_DN5702_c0_g1_i4.p1  ORF type:complete len:516 (+),score=96.87 TRINITY_DN5702_c0_g1_i4:180-1550(+)
MSALASLPENGVLHVPPGTYAITSPLYVNARGTRVKGEGHLIYAFPAHGHIRQGEVPQPHKNESHRNDNTAPWSLFVVNAEDVTFDGLTMSSPYFVEGSQCMLVMASGFVMKGCSVRDFSQGVMLGGSSEAHQTTNIKILGNDFLRIRGLTNGSLCYGDAILSFSIRNLQICHNNISAAPDRMPRNGINCGPECVPLQTDIIISNNQLSGPWDYPITTEGCARSVITGNVIRCECITGIIERGEDVTVTGNSIHVLSRGTRNQNNATSAISFFGVKHGVISSNIISGVGQYGIILSRSYAEHGAWGDHVTVQGNSVKGEFFYGVYLGEAVAKVNISGNDFKIMHSNQDSMCIHGWKARDIAILSNTMDSTGHALVMSGCEDIKIDSNCMYDCRTGIYVNHGSKGLHIVGNQFGHNVGGGKLGWSEDVQRLVHKGNMGLDIPEAAILTTQAHIPAPF